MVGIIRPPNAVALNRAGDLQIVTTSLSLSQRQGPPRNGNFLMVLLFHVEVLVNAKREVLTWLTRLMIDAS